MKPPRNRRLRRWLKAANLLVIQVAHELQRLNRGGNDSIPSAPSSHRQRVRAFKHALAERYREHGRCC